MNVKLLKKTLFKVDSFNNSQFLIEQFLMRITHNSKLKIQNSKFNIQHCA